MDMTTIFENIDVMQLRKRHAHLTIGISDFVLWIEIWYINCRDILSAISD